MITVVREAGYQLLELPLLPNLEDLLDDRVETEQAVGTLMDQVTRFNPDVIVAASKGGLYFNYLWQDPAFSTACVLINAHPNITRLPPLAPMVVTQGSLDETFQRIIERQPVMIQDEQVRDALVSRTEFRSLGRSGGPPALVVE